MNIKINKVEIKSAGPVVSFSEEFKPLTVIYGKNESGKTTIVENILAALFKKGKKNKAVEYLPLLRDDNFLGGSKVDISGLDDNIISFNGKKSLDEYLRNTEESLPISLLNLLFIKEGDAKIIGEKGGLTKDLLKEMIAGSNPLKKIEDNLSKAIKDIKIKDGKFSNFKKNVKESKFYLNALDALEKLQRLENGYWQDAAELKRIQVEKAINQIEIKLIKLEQARKYTAFQIAQDLDILNEEVIGFSEEDLSTLLRDSNELDKSIYKKNEVDAQLKEFSRDRENSHWLEASKESYYKLESATVVNKSVNSVSIASVLLFLAIGLSFVKPIFVPIIGGLSFLLLIVHFFKSKGLATMGNDEENKIHFQELEKGFFSRFGKQLRSIEDLEVEIRILLERQGSLNALNRQFNDLENSIASLEANIGQLLIQTGGNERKLSIGEYVNIKRRELQQRDLQINSLKGKLDSLGVDRSDYLATDPGVIYSLSEINELQRKRNQLQDTLTSLIVTNNNMRQELSGFIGSIANSTPSEVSDKISEKLLELKSIRDSNLAKIIGDYYLNEVLEELKLNEDERLKEFVNSNEVLTRIKKITKKYNRIDFEGEEILIGDDMYSFPLRNLSTGSNEQILLALRMGIAEKLSQSSSLFIILDDAFQSSDWDRRDKLVSNVVDMVKSGWQIIYFTMDDDIRDRFKTITKKMKSNEFLLKELK